MEADNHARMQQSISRWLKLSLAGTLSLIIAILIVPVIFHLYTIDDLWQRTFAVLLGGVITTLVTTLLLGQQTSLQQKLQSQQAAEQSRLQEKMLEQQAQKQLEKEKLAKVYEEKLKNYSAFLFKIHGMIEDGVVEPSEALKLQFDIAQLSMHSAPSSVYEISCQLKEMLDGMGATGEDGGDSVCILEPLMKMVDVFKRELYDGREAIVGEDGAGQRIADAIQNFHAIVDSLHDGQGVLCGEKKSSGQQVFERNLSSVCVRAMEIWKEKELGEGWQISLREQALGLSLRPSGEGWKENRLLILFAYTVADGCYFQLHRELPDEERRELYLAMRRYFGGRFNKYGWWVSLPEEYGKKLASSGLTAEEAEAIALHVADVLGQLRQWVAGRAEQNGNG